MAEAKRRHVWTEILSAPLLVHLALTGRLGRALVQCGRVTVAAVRLAGVMGRLGLMEVEIRPVAIRLADPTPDRRMLIAELFSVMSRAAQDAVSSTDIAWLESGHPAYGPMWRRILAAHWLDVHDRTLRLFCHLTNQYRTDAALAAAAGEVVAVHSGFHGSHVARFAACPPVPVRLAAWWGKDALRAVFKGLVGAAALPFLPALAIVLGWSKPSRKLDGAAVAAGTVLVQAEPVSLSRLPLGHSMDWHQPSGLAPGRLVVYLERGDTPVTPELVGSLEGTGFGWIDFHWPIRHVVRSPERLRRLLCGTWGRLWPALRAGKGDVWLRYAALMPVLEAHRALLEATNAKAIYQHYEFSAGTTVQSLAALLEDVAFLWSTNSVYVFLNPRYQMASVDAVLAHGPHDRASFRAVGMDCRVQFEVGIIGHDGVKGGEAGEAQVLRARLAPGLRHVLAVFGSSHSPEIHHTTASYITFFKALIDWLALSPDWGAIIKVKCEAELDILDGDLRQCLERLRAEGRWLVISDPRPSVCALAADYMLSYSMNSAGFYAQILSNRPGVHADLPGLAMHPAYESGAGGRIAFPDMEQALAAVERMAADDAAVGVLPDFNRSLDRFGDGRGRERAGEVIRLYMENRTAGLNCAMALAATARCYGAARGMELVDIGLDRPALEAEVVWLRVRQHHYSDWAPNLPPVRAF